MYQRIGNKPKEPSLWFVVCKAVIIIISGVFGEFGVECVIFTGFFIGAFSWFLIG